MIEFGTKYLSRQASPRQWQAATKVHRCTPSRYIYRINNIIYYSDSQEFRTEYNKEMMWLTLND